MPSDDDTRYRDTAPPTLGQLRAMLESLTECKALRSKDGTKNRLIFEIDAEQVQRKGGSCYATGEQVAKVLLDTIGRMLYFDQVTEDYANSDKKGTTTADIAAFIANELKHVHSGFDLQSNLRRRMYNETLQKLNELGVWRAAVDAERYRKAQEEQTRQARAAEEATRRYNEECSRREAEFIRRNRDKAEREERESRAGADRKSNRYENMFGDDFTSAFYKDAFGDKDAFRNAYENMRKQGFGSGNFGGAFGGADFAGNSNDRKREEKTQRPKARDKGRAPWYEVLEVSATATTEEVSKAYRRLAARYHPDRYKGADATEKMTAINTARDEALR